MIVLGGKKRGETEVEVLVLPLFPPFVSLLTSLPVCHPISNRKPKHRFNAAYLQVTLHIGVTTRFLLKSLDILIDILITKAIIIPKTYRVRRLLQHATHHCTKPIVK